jgi:hypothetical protein
VVEDRGTLERMKLGPSTFPGGQRVDSPSRYRKWVALSVPEAVMGMPEVPIAPSTTGPPEGWAPVGFVSPASFNRGLSARLLRVLGS